MNVPTRPARSAFSRKSRAAQAGLPAVSLKVFIGYGDVASVRRATSTVADAVHSSGRKVEVQPLLWRFSQLSNPYWHDRAINAARGADIVVLACSTPVAFTPDIEAWVDAFLAANRGHRATIVAISGRSEAWTITIEQPAASVAKLRAPSAPAERASSRLVA